MDLATVAIVAIAILFAATIIYGTKQIVEIDS